MPAPVDHQVGPAPRGSGEGADATRPAPRWRTPALVGLGTAGALGVVAAADPGDGGTPLCWTQGALGFDCPLCGGLRCANALVRGDWLAAADHNVLLAVVLPVVAVAWALWVVAAVRDRPLRVPRPGRSWLAAATVLLVAFTLARNSDANAVSTWLGATAG